MVFPLRPRHEPDEPAHGYVLRLVEANGYTWSGDALAQRGAGLAELAVGDSFDFLTTHGNADVDRLAFATARPVGEACYQLCGEVLAGTQIVFGRKRFCGECWTEDRRQSPAGDGLAEPAGRARFRSWWSVAAVAACPIHRIRMTENCFVCTRACMFGRGTLTTCSCGADLTEMVGLRVDEGSVRVEAYIAGRLGGVPPTRVPILDEFPLGNAIELLSRLGSLAGIGRVGRLRDDAPHDRAALASAGMAIVVDGDCGVEAALSSRLDVAATADGLPAAFGSFYGWFRELPDGPQRAWLGQRMSAVARSKRILWTNWCKHVPTDPLPECITGEQAGGILGLSEQPTRRVLRLTGLLRSDGKKRIRPTIDRSAVERLRRELGRLVDLPTAAARMGVAPKSMLALTKHGIFQPSAVGCAAFGNRTVFDPAELDAVLSQIAGRSIRVDRAPPDARRLPKAARGVGLHRLCSLVLAGELVPCGLLKDGRGLGAVLIDRKDCRSSGKLIERDRMQVRDAARHLGVRERAMSLLVSRGHLGAPERSGGWQRIRRDDIERFKVQQISSSELARAWGTNTTSVLRRMKEAGLRPTIELVHAERTEVRFFERTLAEAAMSGRVTQSPTLSAGAQLLLDPICG